MGDTVRTAPLLLLGSGAISGINAAAKSRAGLPQSMQRRWLPCPHAGLEGASRRSSWASSCTAWATEPCWAPGGWPATMTSGALTRFEGTRSIPKVWDAKSSDERWCPAHPGFSRDEVLSALGGCDSPRGTQMLHEEQQGW